jgi:hypothetical protein
VRGGWYTFGLTSRGLLEASGSGMSWQCSVKHSYLQQFNLKKVEVDPNFISFMKQQNSCFTNWPFELYHEVRSNLSTSAIGYIKKSLLFVVLFLPFASFNLILIPSPVPSPLLLPESVSFCHIARRPSGASGWGMRPGANAVVELSSKINGFNSIKLMGSLV